MSNGYRFTVVMFCVETCPGVPWVNVAEQIVVKLDGKRRKGKKLSL